MKPDKSNSVQQNVKPLTPTKATSPPPWVKLCFRSTNDMTHWGKVFISLSLPAWGLIQLATKGLWTRHTAGLSLIIICKLSAL